MASFIKTFQNIVMECITKDINLEFPDFLKNLRVKIGFTSKSFSSLIGISSTDYSDFESKNYFRTPTEKQLIKIADFYDLNIIIFKEKLVDFLEDK